MKSKPLTPFFQKMYKGGRVGLDVHKKTKLVMRGLINISKSSNK